MRLSEPRIVSCYSRELRSADLSSGITKVLDKVVRESAGGGALILINLGDVLRILARRTAAFCFSQTDRPHPASRLLTFRAILSL